MIVDCRLLRAAVVLGGGAFSYERGTPVREGADLDADGVLREVLGLHVYPHNLRRWLMDY